MHRFLAGIGLLLGMTGELGAQAGASDTGHVLLDQRFTADTDSAVILLRKRTVYRAELSGSDSLTVIPLESHHWPPLVVPMGFAPGGLRVFEIHPGSTGPYRVRVFRVSGDSAAVLRIHGDSVETRRVARGRERNWGIGVGLAGGFHSGYRLDPTGGTDPSGGGDIEGYLVIEGGFPVSLYLGVARQSFPDGEFVETWYLLEPRLRLLSGTFLGSSRTDFGVTLRIAQGGEVGSREISPSQLGAGIYVNHHLATDGRRRGWSIFGAYQYARLGNVPETEHRDTDRVLAGLTWVP